MVEEFREWVRAMCRPSTMLGRNAGPRVQKLCKAIKEEIRSQRAVLIAKAQSPDCPMMVTYMSDGWGCKVSTNTRLHVGSQAINREGKYRAEFLLEKSVMKTLSPCGRIFSSLCWDEPRSLSSGKSGWYVFAAATDHDNVIRSHKPEGIVLTMVLQDGLHAQSMGRRMQARGDLFYDCSDDNDVATDAWHPIRLKDWHFRLRCVAHSLSSAISWGLAEFSSKALLDEVHIGIASCQNTSTEIFQVVTEYVYDYSAFQRSDFSEEQRRNFWLLLGVDHKILPEVLAVDPRWDSSQGRLLLNPDLQLKPGWRDSAESVIMYFLRWRGFSETRWAGVGPCCRMFIASMYVGLDKLVKLVYDRPGLSTYYLGGFGKLGHQGRLYMTIAAVACKPVESVNLEVMQDDRFLKRGCLIC